MMGGISYIRWGWVHLPSACHVLQVHDAQSVCVYIYIHIHVYINKKLRIVASVMHWQYHLLTTLLKLMHHSN